MPSGKRATAAELQRQLEEVRDQLRQTEKKLQEARRQLRRERQEKTQLWQELGELGLAEQLELARRAAQELQERLRQQDRRRKA